MHERHTGIAVIATMTMLAALPVTSVQRAAAQTIEWSRDIEAPALVAPTLASTIIGVLEAEAQAQRAEADAATAAPARTALLARANLRLLSAELLAAGDRAAAPGSEDVIRGMKLAFNRERFDRLFDSTAAKAAEGSSAGVDAMNAFNQRYADHLQRGEAGEAAGAAQGDHWLAALLSRLTPLVVLPGEPPLESHWVIDVHAAAASSPDSMPKAGARSLTALRRRAEAAPVSDQARANLLSAIDFLERGSQFADLASQIVEHQRMVNVYLDFADTAAAADWLIESQRIRLQEQVQASIEMFLDPQRRPQALEAAERFEAWRAVLAAASTLEDDDVESKTLRSVFDALDAADQQAAGQREAVRILVQAGMVFERMVEARAHEPAGLSRELRIVQRDLMRDYRATEEKIFKEVAGGALTRGSLADPSVASLLADHRERVEDLRRLRRLPEWSAAINRIHQPAAKDFDLHMRRRAQALLEPTKQPETRRDLDRFHSELQRFERLPAEQSLRDNHPAAAQLTGGQQAAMLALITERRRAWADDWSRAEPTPEPARAMDLLHRLMQSLRDAAALIDIKPDALNRWPGWQLSESIVEAGQSDVVTRLKLACAAAAGGDMNALAEQIERIDRESPLAKVAGRLMSRLGNDLRERDDGAAGVLAQLTIAPADHALFAKHALDLARLCRYAAEAAAARDAGNANVARECDEYVNALAQHLLEQLVEAD